MKFGRLVVILSLSLGLLAFSQSGLKLLAAQAVGNQPEIRGLAGPAAAPLQVAQTVTLTPSKDNTLYESATGELSNGAGEYFFAGRTNQGSDSLRRGLIAFDLAGSVPTGSVILSVTLRLHLSMGIGSVAEPVELHRLTTDWGEGGSDASGQEGSGAPAQAGDATWTQAITPTTPWLTPGGDFTSTASAVTGVNSSDGFYNWATTPALVADLQAWLDNPASNFGWILVGNETGGATARRFDSAQNSVPANQPQLIIEYQVDLPEALYLPLVLR